MPPVDDIILCGAILDCYWKKTAITARTKGMSPIEFTSGDYGGMACPDW